MKIEGLKTELIAEPVPIGTAAGWELSFMPDASDHPTAPFTARKGRKERKAGSLRALLSEIDDSEAEAAREKVKKIPCEFPHYLGGGKWQRAELTSFSTKGAYVRGVVEAGAWKNEGDRASIKAILVLRGDPIEAAQALSEAEERVARAKLDLAAVRQGRLHAVEVPYTGYGTNRVRDFHAAEDKLKATINELPDVRREPA